MRKKMMTPKFHKPFSPIIMETQVPDRFVDIVNTISDKVISSDSASREWDWSHMLVGKVHKEIQIPVRDNDDKEFLMQVMKGGCVDYLKESIKSNTAYGWRKIADNAIPTMVIYLKLPPKMHEEIEEDFKDHYPANGLIEFMFGENQEFRSDNLKFKPEVGKMLIFPSWLKHFVYPFKSEGERRSMSFNAHMHVPKPTREYKL